MANVLQRAGNPRWFRILRIIASVWAMVLIGIGGNMVAGGDLTLAQALIMGFFAWSLPLGALYAGCAVAFGTLSDRRAPPSAP